MRDLVVLKEGTDWQVGRDLNKKTVVSIAVKEKKKKRFLTFK